MISLLLRRLLVALALVFLVAMLYVLCYWGVVTFAEWITASGGDVTPERLFNLRVNSVWWTLVPFCIVCLIFLGVLTADE